MLAQDLLRLVEASSSNSTAFGWVDSPATFCLPQLRLGSWRLICTGRFSAVMRSGTDVNPVHKLPLRHLGLWEWIVSPRKFISSKLSNGAHVKALISGAAVQTGILELTTSTVMGTVTDKVGELAPTRNTWTWTNSN